MRAFLLHVCVILIINAVAMAELNVMNVKYSYGTYSTDTHSSLIDIDLTAPAYLVLNRTLYDNGWHVLHVVSNNQYSDEMQMYAAGYGEGILTAAEIEQWYISYFKNEFHGDPKQDLLDFIVSNMNWMRDMVLSYKDSDPFWMHVHLILRQFDGLCDGYAFAARELRYAPISCAKLFILASAGDMETLIDKFYPKNSPKVYDPSMPLDCTAFIKILPDKSDLFTAHDTWSSYYSMLRIYKTYTFPLNNAATAAKTIMMSSRPAFLCSKDDFYQNDVGIVSLETTNAIFDDNLLNAVKPESVFSWIRVMIANRVTASGKEWVEIFKRYNSGTYNNQWMVVDYKRKSETTDLLWIAEQVPAKIHSSDVTSVFLKQGYWPSFNVPYFNDIRTVSHYPIDAYTEAPRYKILARDQSKVTDFESMKTLMRSNHYKTDPFSNNDPANAISSRYDLRTEKHAYFGALDSKVTSVERVDNVACAAVSGPTDQDQPAFKWSDQTIEPIPLHEGCPDFYNFPFVEMKARIK